MAVAESTTIRVSKRTRDRLARVAVDRGVSVTELVAEMARAAYREMAFASEREAQRLDSQNPEALAEHALWEETLGDGID